MIVPKMLQRANQYVAIEALVAGKREDQKRSCAKSSRGLPTGPLRRRMERTETTIPRLLTIPSTLLEPKSCSKSGRNASFGT
ncbi:hypothetical protein B296_00056604 [Ensete ventricosum]|uniref:Uncharacterized protein n=1 Tax=Ensete ventricosum TaxID=4639 RepID=A0A426XQ51_ENSVE|nr:hypothetical protein B296_00056604 [Ensete ventricosum]